MSQLWFNCRKCDKKDLYAIIDYCGIILPQLYDNRKIYTKQISFELKVQYLVFFCLIKCVFI